MEKKNLFNTFSITYRCNRKQKEKLYGFEIYDELIDLTKRVSL